MEFYCTETRAMQNLSMLFDIYGTLKRYINDEKISDATKKAILTIFNKYGKKVYNKTENSFYKRIMNKNTVGHKASSYRYYPNGLVYRFYLESCNKNNIEEEYTLLNSNTPHPIMVLKEYKIPASFEKKIEANKEQIKEAQLKAINEQKKKEARRKAIADRKKAKKGVEIEKTKNPYLSFLDRKGYSSKNAHSNFIRYQLSKWYKDVRQPVVPKIFRDNPPLYKIMEKLNQINEDINLKTVVKDFHFEYQVKDNHDDYIHKWRSPDNILSKYPTMINLNTIQDEIDTLIGNKICKDYVYLFQEIFRTFFYSHFTCVRSKNDYINGAHDNIKTYFTLIKDKDAFENIEAKDRDALYCNCTILDELKYSNMIDVKLSEECTVRTETVYKHGIYDGKNIIASPYLSAICEAWPIFIKKVKECEYGEEWLERVGFIPPKNNIEE